MSITPARRPSGSAIAEFGPAMWLLFVFIIFPVVDMLSFVWGIGTVMLIANYGVRQAATASSFTDAKTSITKTETDLGKFSNFAKLNPIPGPSGVSIICSMTPSDPANPANTNYSGPGGIPVDDISLAGNIYQYKVTASYNVLPLMNFQGVPILSNIPGLGQPVPVNFTSTASVEHPEGLNQ